MGPNHRFASPRIAYFSMEIGLQSSIPTYSGGLGVLAGDTIKAAADIGVPMIGVTLLQRKGYLRQRLDESGWQIEEAPAWRVEDSMHELPERVTVQLEGRTVVVRAWRRDVHGVTGHSVPVIYLDTDLDGNDHPDRALTGQLYGGDNRYRLKQETVLGPGGFRMLRALGLGTIDVYHLNEGHAALLAGELLRQVLTATGKSHVDAEAVELVRRRCVFTTHTPVPAGHDRFPLALAREVLGHHPALEASGLFDRDGDLHMTIAALNLSRFINGVSRKHGEVSRAMFPGRDIRSITNGVHHNTWVGPEMAALFDRHFHNWRVRPSEMRGMLRVPEIEVWDAHHAAKSKLLAVAQGLGAPPMDPGAFTIGFARRATAYKRADMLLSDPHRLRAIAQAHGPIQLLFAGKAHPRDHHGKEIIQNLIRAFNWIGDGSSIKAAYLPDYDMDLCGTLVAGVDLWLNTPEPPLEASGTSGMKAAMNGVPMLSTLDGWWIEGCIEGVTGWAIQGSEHGRDAETRSLYDQLDRAILPLYHKDRPRWIGVMRHTIAVNGSHFTADRMLRDYVTQAYFA